MLSSARNHRQLKNFCASLGSELFGVADISAVKSDFNLSKGVLDKLDRAVCLGVGLSRLVLSEIDREPTKLYFHHYRTANVFLDQMAFAVAQWIQRKGHLAVAIPSSQIIDWEAQKGHLSHKKIGYLAGLGWIGRNNLLVTGKFGAQFRMATVLTDMKLKADRPLAGGCGQCFLCLEICPVGAIRERPEDFGHLVCFDKLKSFQKQNIVGQFICGICVKACASKEVKFNG